MFSFRAKSGARFRSAGRDRETDEERLAAIESAVREALVAAEREKSALGQRLEQARTTATILAGTDTYEHETRLPEKTAGVWHGHVEGIGPGHRYGYRVHGPFDPDNGQRFNRNKLLIVGGVATLFILFFIIAFKLDRRTSSDSPQEPLRATVADRQSAADLASTVPPIGTTTDSLPPENKQESSKIIRKSADALQRLANKRVVPTYPPIAKSARVSGSVVVEVTIDEQGNVTSARAISGHPLLQQAAVEAAKGWKFSPPQLNDTPVKEIGTITFNFTLE